CLRRAGNEEREWGMRGVAVASNLPFPSFPIPFIPCPFFSSSTPGAGMLPAMRPVPRLPATAVLCLSAAAVQAAVVERVEIRGLDEAMTDNVRLSLSLVESIGKDVSGRRMAYLVREAENEAREALRPFGYYSPEVTVERDREAGVVTITIV